VQRSFVVVIVAVVALFAAEPVAAKSGFEARLDRAMPDEPSAGSTVQVGWTLIDPRTDGVLEGISAFLRIRPWRTPPFDVIGREGPGGHYSASFVAPPGGIALLEIGMLNENCVDDQCTRSDMMFPIDEPERELADGAAPTPPTEPGLAASRTAAPTPTSDAGVAAAAAVLTPIPAEYDPPPIVESPSSLLPAVLFVGALVVGATFAAAWVVLRISGSAARSDQSRS